MYLCIIVYVYERWIIWFFVGIIKLNCWPQTTWLMTLTMQARCWHLFSDFLISRTYVMISCALILCGQPRDIWTSWSTASMTTSGNSHHYSRAGMGHYSIGCSFLVECISRMKMSVHKSQREKKKITPLMDIRSQLVSNIFSEKRLWRFHICVTFLFRKGKLNSWDEK